MQWLVDAGENRHVASPDSANSLNACYCILLSSQDLLYGSCARLYSVTTRTLCFRKPNRSSIDRAARFTMVCILSNGLAESVN